MAASTFSSSSSDAFDSGFEELVEKLASLDNTRSLLNGLGSAIVNPLNSKLEELVEKLGFLDMRSLLDGLSPLVNLFSLPSSLGSETVLVRRFVSELKYWNKLKQLLVYVHKYSNADKVVENWGSLIIKIEAAFDEIAQELFAHELFAQKLRTLRRKKTQALPSSSHWNAVKALHDSVTKIWLSKVQIGDALNHLSANCRSLEWHLPCLAGELLLKSISGILECFWLEHPGNQNLDQDQRQQLKAFDLDMIFPLREFLGTALADVDKSVYPNDHIIGNFFAPIGFMALRMANQSFQCWFNKIADPVVAKNKIIGLLDMRRDIDPLSPQFLMLMLKFLRALNKISPGRTQHLVSTFLFYILPEGVSNDCRKKLEPLIILLINESEEPPSEEMQSLLINESDERKEMQNLVAEIRAMLILVVHSSRNVQLLNVSSHELQARVYLLDVEVFLKQQLKCSMISLENKVDELVELLFYLGIGSDQPQRKIENEEQTLMLFIDVATDIACLYQSFLDEKITEGMVRNSLPMLLLKIVIFKAKSSCLELLKSMNPSASIMSLGKELIETILEGVKVFAAFFTHQEKKMTFIMGVNLIFAHIEASARSITSLYYSFVVNRFITEEIIEETILSFTGLLDKMANIKEELTGICPPMPRPNFPKVPGLDFIDFLQENLSEQLKHGPHSIALISHHGERILSDLVSMRSFLMKLDSEHPELKDLGARVRNVAYKSGYIIDLIEVGTGDYWQHLLWLHDIREEIRLLKIDSSKIYEEKKYEAREINVAHISSQIKSKVGLPEIGQLGVCLTKDEELIIDRLTRGSSQRDVISIVGMPGIGKTTLANKVYNNRNVTFHFHIRAWCSVSQGYTKRELLLDLLSHTCGFTDNVHQKADEDLDLMLYQSLKQRRYLIVMDDVWDNEAWNALKGSFPDDGKGSRVLMTSRLYNVALEAKPDSVPHRLRLLSDDESWELLQMKISHGGCPKELLEVGKEIAKKCKGLPLAIVAITGVLERTEKKQEKWKRIAGNLSQELSDDPQTRCMDILQLSYNHLPDYLKACFLYFGAFLEGRDIPVGKLIRLWVAEGLIRKTMLNSLEDLAEDFLTDLIGRSLVTVSKRGSSGRVKTCRIHDLLRDLCLSKAKEENFLQVITGSDEPYASRYELDSGFADFYDYFPSSPVTYEGYRMCICLKRKHFIRSRPYGQCSRSLIFIATSDENPTRPYDISFVPRHFKLLRVLDLESINMGSSFPTGIELLVQLRYLALSGHIDSIPSSIANLQKLETLIVKGLMDKINLPESIWSMSRLRHIHVTKHVFNLQDDKFGSFLQLDNLVSLSSLSLNYGKNSDKIMRRFPNLRKLRCIFLESWDLFRNCIKLSELDSLVQLESLKIFYCGRVFNPGFLTLPLNLKKLTLSNFRLPWGCISAVGRLQNLEVLKLLSRAFEGERWDMNEGEFLKLRYLKLDTLNIAQWNASDDHLPNLQQLALHNCPDLEEVPSAFGDIPTLQVIEVQSCRRSAEESVSKIGDEGIEGLKIIINHKIHD